MIKCIISEHPSVPDGFLVDVFEVSGDGALKDEVCSRLIVSRELKLGSRNDNFARAFAFAELETKKAVEWAKKIDCIDGENIAYVAGMKRAAIMIREYERKLNR